MYSTFRQSLLISRLNLGSVSRRLWISLSMIVAVALVIAVLIGFLSMARGFEQTLDSTGSDTVAVVLGGGTTREAGSEIPAGEIRRLQGAAEELAVARDDSGEMLLSREIMVPIDALHAEDGTPRTVSLRGMDGVGADIRDSATVVEGRMFDAGARELVVGDRVARDYQGFEVGDSVTFGGSTWTVVGRFAAGGSAFESELWGNLSAVRADFSRQGETQSLRVALTDPDAVRALQEHLDQTAAIPMRVLSEREYFSAQSGRTADLIRMFGWPLALLMAIGATAGALNTMLTSVSDRQVEAATLRSMGFGRVATFVGTWIESAVLSLVGAVVGGVASVLAFDGMQAAAAGDGSAQLGFAFSVTPDIVIQAGLLGLAIGLLGGGIPALKAARMPLKAAMRNER